IFDAEISGNILVDPLLALDSETLIKDLEQDGGNFIAVESGGTIKSEPGCLNLSSSADQWCVLLKRLRLDGIDFRLYDYRNLYPQANRMSFVFIESPEVPSLNGCLA